MPRRNRNAHTTPVDADELASRAAQLATELASPPGLPGCIVPFPRTPDIGR
jgi:hypothetical protein